MIRLDWKWNSIQYCYGMKCSEVLARHIGSLKRQTVKDTSSVLDRDTSVNCTVNFIGYHFEGR